MAGYTRNDTLNNIADGNVISAADLDGEFDAIDAAFDEATGHVHDGTANNGAPITKVGPAQDLVVSTGAVTPKTDNAVDLGTSSFEFKDLYIDGTANIDSLVADTADINGGSIDAVTIGTNSVVTDLRVDNLRLDGNTISSTDTNGNIVLAPNGTGDVVPGTDDTYDLGSSSAEWKDLFIDGTANIDSLVADTADINAGTIDNTTIGGSTAAAGTFTTATATTGNITNVNATTVDTTNIEVTNIKAKDGTSAGSIADSTGVVTLTSTVLTTTDINGGTIDGTTIGGASAAAGTFTTATATTGNITTVNATTVDTTNIEVTNIKAKDGTASATIADSTGVMTVASSVLTTTDINGGTIDGTAIGGASAAAGAFTTLSASGVTTVQAGTVSAPAITTTGDTNTGIFFPAADTIAFAEGGAEAMRIDSSARVGIGTTSPEYRLDVRSGASYQANFQQTASNSYGVIRVTGNSRGGEIDFYDGSTALAGIFSNSSGKGLQFMTNGISTTRMTIDSSGNVGIGTSSPVSIGSGYGTLDLRGSTGSGYRCGNSTDSAYLYADSTSTVFGTGTSKPIVFVTNNAERARIDTSGNLLVGTTSANPAVLNVAGAHIANNRNEFSVDAAVVAIFNRKTDDGELIQFRQAGTSEGTISVSGNTVSYNAFCGGHWTQLQEGRGYNPDIPRGTVMSSIGEMAVWKSVEWPETIEHPAVEAVEAVEAVLDEDGNVIEPAVEAVEGKEAWTETFNKREAYLGNLDIGETFEEDGFTKTVVDDGNERLPKVKISDVVGDKAVYGVFQTWDDVEDMLVSSLGAFVVRIASGVTVEVGDLLESNGDGCAKVQDDDIIRSKTIGKVTSTVATDTYDDGSYTVPCVLYCG
jgi:hypothetical protein